MDRSWMLQRRTSPAYVKGVEEFLEHAEKNATDPSAIPCPCVNCVNGLFWTKDVIKVHLTNKGIDQRYAIWCQHGEDFPVRSEPVNASSNTQTNGSGRSGRSDQFQMEAPQDEALQDEAPLDAQAAVDMMEAIHEEFIDHPGKFKKMLEDAEKPLYPGCSNFTKLSTLVKLFNIKAKSGMSDNKFTELLEMLGGMLPDGNEIPSSAYEAKKALSALGLGYVKIHACPNDCILYRKEYENQTSCPKCGVSRWKVNKHDSSNETKGVPAKVLWYFPIIPRFKRMFQSPETAEHLIWHSSSNEKNVDGKLRHPSDSPQWKMVDHKWPNFGKDPRNLRLAVSADGINPHSNLSSRHSCWPILMCIYNLPPWLCMKRKFMMLTMLISGPHQPGNDIDVYLAPLIEDLKSLWEVGVETYDAYQRQSFTLRAAVLWTINDFPAYGILSGCTVKGYNACPICAQNTFSIRLKHSMKNIYTGHRRFLPRNHVFRKQKKVFNGEVENESAPTPLTGEQVFEQVQMIENSWGKEKKITTNCGTSKKSKRPVVRIIRRKRKASASGVTPYWKKKSIFFELEYWKHLYVRHCLDFMHIEKNVGESLIGTLLNIPGKTKDGLKARMDLKEMGLRTDLAPDDISKKRTRIPPACFTLSKEEKTILCKTILDMKTPEGYSSNLRNCVSMEELKLYGLKSHDYHILMQQLLPLAIRSILPKNVRYAITRFCFFLNAICSKEVDVNELGEMQKDLIVTLCLLEKYFPPAFFDIMIHLTVHLYREVKLCGPVYFRWMYPFERYMKVLKGYVRNRNRPEGCIAECYIAEEALEFCSEFLSVETIGIPPCRNEAMSDDEVTNLVTDGKPASGASMVDVDYKLLSQAHRTVLENTTEILPYIEKHMVYLKRKYPKEKNEKWLQEEHNRTFIDWIREHVDEELTKESRNNISDVVKWIAHGPHHHVFKYHGYDINGYRFHTKSRDLTRVKQNSGVSIVATGMHIATARDHNPVIGDSCYYGVIDEIWLLDYNKFRIPVFKCNWVDGTGIKTDELGFKLVELGKIGHKKDSFILAAHAKQVFYVEDQLDADVSIAIPTPQKDYLRGDDDDDTVNPECQIPFNNIMPNIDPFDITDDSQSGYVRTELDAMWVDANGVAHEDDQEGAGENLN